MGDGWEIVGDSFVSKKSKVYLGVYFEFDLFVHSSGFEMPKVLFESACLPQCSWSESLLFLLVLM